MPDHHINTSSLPKAILYSWPTSVWSTVPQLTLIEKGYSEEEYVIKQVDITRGENFSPSYLKINVNGTIPTLVVPTYETTGEEMETRYRSLKDTGAICDFLDQARSADTHNTISDKPAPALGPATIEAKEVSDDIIELVHSPLVDPNFLNMSARSAEELKFRAARAPGKILQARKEALEKHLAEAKELAAKGGAWEAKLVPFLDSKQTANEALWALYNGLVGEELIEAFYAASRKTWEEDIPAALDKIEKAIQGPFLLGDQLCLADLHLISWLTRLITIAPGAPDMSGLEELQKQFNGKTIGPKVREFFSTWTERESFQKVLVTSASAFTKAAGE